MDSNPAWEPFGSHGLCYKATDELTLTFLGDLQALFHFPTLCYALWVGLLPLEYKAWLALANAVLVSLEVYLLGTLLPIPIVCPSSSSLDMDLNYSFDPIIILITVFSLSGFHVETPLKQSLRTWFYPTSSLLLLAIAGSSSLLLGLSNLFTIVLTVVASVLIFYYAYVTPFALRTIDLGILLGCLLLLRPDTSHEHLSLTMLIVGISTTFLPWFVVTLDRCSFHSLLFQAIIYPYFLALRKPLKRVSQRKEYRPLSCTLVYYLILLLCLTQFTIFLLDFAFV